ncbi:MAG TPA: class I SAM-dependent methyltransferase [Bacteroidia bacterium]|nr:class I SAM-dependent methyltransferase [Bacteroidia bacterium]
MEHAEQLTEKSFWDDMWSESHHVINPDKNKNSAHVRRVLDIFERYLSINENLNILEIGGAGGGYLMYMVKNFKYRAYSLDYSDSGNELTAKYFSKAGVPVKIFQRDLFSDLSDLPKFDIVYSLGLIEHFSDPLPCIAKHYELLKPNGILILGVPNLGGIYTPFLKVLAPEELHAHNLKTMKLRAWNEFEKKFNLKIIFRDYVGGFEPAIMHKQEKKSSLTKVFLRAVKFIAALSYHYPLKLLKKYDSGLWSGYLIGVYQKGA